MQEPDHLFDFGLASQRSLFGWKTALLSSSVVTRALTGGVISQFKDPARQSRSCQDDSFVVRFYHEPVDLHGLLSVRIKPFKRPVEYQDSPVE